MKDTKRGFILAFSFCSRGLRRSRLLVTFHSSLPMGPAEVRLAISDFRFPICGFQSTSSTSITSASPRLCGGIPVTGGNVRLASHPLVSAGFAGGKVGAGSACSPDGHAVAALHQTMRNLPAPHIGEDMIEQGLFLGQPIADCQGAKPRGPGLAPVQINRICWFHGMR
jgi:hypothetical protein